jgi:two-component sensor histidine kinase
MSLVHEHLYKTADFKEINLKKYIPELIDNIKGNFLLNEDKVEVKYNINETALDITKAIPVGILLNEIISNSFKHAFPDSKEGTVTVDVKQDNGRCLLTVGDNGIGGKNASEKYHGDGSGIELIKMLVNQLSGEINCDYTAGYKYEIIFPVNG